MILITGATGTSGAEIVKSLLAHGERPRVLARDPEKAARLLGDDVEIARGNFSDAASLVAAMDDVDRALLLTPPSQGQVELQKNFIDAAARNRLSHIVKYSAAGADEQSASTFARQHGIS